MKFSDKVIFQLILTIIGFALTTLVFDYINDLNTDDWVIISKLSLKSIWLTLIFLCLLSAYFLINRFYKRKKTKKNYSPLQIEIAQKILDRKIKHVNDFFIQYFKPKLLEKPFNSLDYQKNYFTPKDKNERTFLIRKFKELISDLIKYNCIDLIQDDSIELFTYLRKSDYPGARDGMEMSHDLAMAFQKDYKQKRFIVKNHKELKKLIKIKALPKQN